MPLFKVPERAGKKQDKSIIQKSKSVRKAPVRGANNLLGKITQITSEVEKKLGEFKDQYIVIQDTGELHNYFIKCIENNVISIDTETTGLDPMEDKIVGLCVYTPDMPAAYIPINHVSYITGMRIEEQLMEEEVCEEFRFLLEKHPEIIMFNACFDIRVIRNQLKCRDIYCTWDCYLASRLMNENEPDGQKGLKALYKKYILNGEKDTFSFDALFEGMSFNLVPIKTAYLYAAHDAIITYELYMYQKKYLYYDSAATPEDRNGMNGVSWVFFNIEMPCVSVVADMEDTGVLFDIKYQSQLSEKYNKLLKQKEEKFYRTCDDFGEDLDKYRAKMGVANKLEYPINISSSSQIAIMLYDVLKIKPVDKKKPRGTGEEILSKIDHPVAKAVLEYREVKKLLTTYIDKLPECVGKDGRIHCRFNQYGADTGRFSSSDPNLQNIPSRNHDIRKMFVATQEEKVVDFDTDDFLEVDKFTEIFTNDEWVTVSRFGIGDTIDICGELFTISNIEEINEKVRIYL